MDMKYYSNMVAKMRKIICGYRISYCVGLDISSTSVKMLELIPNSLKIRKYNIKLLAKDLVCAGVINDIDRVAEIISLQWSNFRSDCAEVAISIPYDAVVVKTLGAPKFKTRFELDNFVKNELTTKLETEDIDFDYLIKSSNNNLDFCNKEFVDSPNIPTTVSDTQDLAVVVARKDKIEEYQAVIQMAGMQVAAIDVEPFAIQYLFESLLLPKIKHYPHVLILDLGANRMRAFVFAQQKLILFNEINVNYHSYLAGMEALDHIHEYAIKTVKVDNNSAIDLVSAVIMDVVKLLQILKSSLHVEKKINLAKTTQVYVMGGNSLLPGIIDKISTLLNTPVVYAADLLGDENKHIPQQDLVRLFTAIALATWGHCFDQN